MRRYRDVSSIVMTSGVELAIAASVSTAMIFQMDHNENSKSASKFQGPIKNVRSAQLLGSH